MRIGPLPLLRCLVIVPALGTSACAVSPLGPAAAFLPAMTQLKAPVASAVPMVDGSLYVTVDAPARASPSVLARMWRHKAGDTCKGEYMVLVESATDRQAAGRRSGRRHEGYVRCLNPEAVQDLQDGGLMDGDAPPPSA